MVREKSSLSHLVNSLTALAFGIETIIAPGCSLAKKIVHPSERAATASAAYTPRSNPVIVGPSYGEEETRTTWDRYGENIIYMNFSDIDFNSLTSMPIEIPSDLEDSLEQPNVENWQLLENIMFGEASKLGYDMEDIGQLSAKEAIDLSVKIVCKRLKYFDVDWDEKFIKKYGAHLPIERYLEIGKGDCDKYADAFLAIFNMMKRINPHLKNVYASDGSLGGNILMHKWNSLVFLEEDKIFLTHIDLTAYDNKGSLEGKIDIHVPEDKDLLLAQVYMEIADFSHSYDFYGRVLDKCGTVECKAETLDSMIFLAYMMEDREKADFVRKEFLQLGPEELLCGALGRYYENILYYSYKTEKKKGDPELAEKLREELLKRFPNSHWLKNTDH